MQTSVSELAASPFALAALALLALGAILTVAGIVALFRARPLRFMVRTLAGLLLVALGALSGAIGVGMQGYRALTREDLAARLVVKPAGEQRFGVILTYPDGRTERYALAGDEVYLDAHILKWRPWANFFGLHTAYELDRISGRYRAIEDEQSKPRTVHALGRERPVDLFALRQRYAFLAPALDAEYGSATFVPVSGPAELELRVSTSGLLLRKTGGS
jgi:hypothetical protein